MKVEQTQWVADKGWAPTQPSTLGRAATVVFMFGSRAVLRQGDLVQQTQAAHPNAQIFGCSTAGEILGAGVFDDSLVVTAVAFENTRVEGATCKINSTADSRVAGQRLAQSIAKEGLAHVLVLSDGLAVNGSELALGLAEFLPPYIAVTGGLSADGAHFQETLVLFNAAAEPNTIAILGFYGDKLKVGYGSLGGWDQFGPERLITKSEGNVLYELDGKSALDLYKRYLGDQAKELPASALLFPLSIRRADGEAPLVRTILGINEKEQSMTFAGEVPAGATARLMKANFDRLIEGAAGAARATCTAGMKGSAPELALLISCVGRKLILRQRIEEEVEGSLQADTTNGKGQSPAGTEDLQGLRVLVVDDSASSRSILQRMLERWHTLPECADSGPAGLTCLEQAAAQRRPFDLSLVDERMPGMNGLEFLQHVRANPVFRSLRVVLMTCAEQGAKGMPCDEVGVESCLTKPVDPQELLEILRKVVGKAPPEELREPAAKASAMRPLRILVAEDNLVNQKVTSTMLGRMGHEVTLAETGAEAVNRWREREFDLVLMDVHMPQMDGLDAVRSIREYEQTTGTHTPIVAMTAHALSGDRDLCLEAGMDDFVTKPVSRRNLEQTIARYAARLMDGPARPEVLRQQPQPFPSGQPS